MSEFFLADCGEWYHAWFQISSQTQDNILLFLHPVSRMPVLANESLLYDRSFCATLITRKPRHLFTFIANRLALSHERYIKQRVVAFQLLSVQNSAKRHTEASVVTELRRSVRTRGRNAGHGWGIHSFIIEERLRKGVCHHYQLFRLSHFAAPSILCSVSVSAFIFSFVRFFFLALSLCYLRSSHCSVIKWFAPRLSEQRALILAGNKRSPFIHERTRYKRNKPIRVMLLRENNQWQTSVMK